MSKIEKLEKIMALLRDPQKGCPWDIEQDFKSIAPHTIEEAYEVVDAIEKDNMQALKEELGDLLLQVIFYSQMANEKDLFSFDDVVSSINEKLVQRHPHVFGNETIKTAQEQEISWEMIKKEERDKKSQDGQSSILDGIALALPALTRSVKLQKRAAEVGFDWPDLKGVFDKIEEEITELKDAIDRDNINHIAEEYGDLLFILSNLGRKLKVKPEDCLRTCNNKFERRFHYIEQKLDIKNASLEEMDKFWDEAKLSEVTNASNQ